MIELEDRLRDAFRAVDAQVVVPPRRDDVPVERHIGRWLVAAAAVIAVVAGSSVFAAHYDDTERVGVVSNDTPVSPAEFDARASALCQQIFRDRSGVQPRFATLEAYRVVADQRAELVRRALHDVAALAPPSDDEKLLAAVVRSFRLAANGVEVVQHYYAVGDLDGAAFAWPDIDGSINDAMTIMYRHGASGCQE